MVWQAEFTAGVVFRLRWTTEATHDQATSGARDWGARAEMNRAALDGRESGPVRQTA